MRTSEVAREHAINREDFDKFLEENKLQYTKDNYGSVSISDSNERKYVIMFKEWIAPYMIERAKEAAERAAIEAKEAAIEAKEAAERAAIEAKEAAERAAIEAKEAAERAAIEAKEAAERAAIEAKGSATILISSGFNFDGYTITKYSGYISGDDAIQIPRSGVFGGDNGSNLTNALVSIRRQALIELKKAAYNLGCNAVIGVDFDYLTLEPESVNLLGGTLYEPYIICVTANGNAVFIEKNK